MLQHTDGVSPAWPLGYDVFEPYYGQAEALFHVHGKRGEDPTEPWSSTPFAYEPVSHEPRIQELNDNLEKDGLRPFHLPLGILMDEKDGKVTPTSPCIRCDAFDGFPCAINAKADAQVICIDPTLKQHDNFTLLTGAYVSRLETDRKRRRRHQGSRHAQRRARSLFRRYRGCGLRRAEFGAAAAAFRQR